MVDLINPLDRIAALIALGGPVVALLLLLSVVALAIILFKAWQYARLGTGVGRTVDEAVRLWLDGRRQDARSLLASDRTLLGTIVGQAMQAAISRPSDVRDLDLEDRLAVEAGAQIRQLESGFRALDSIAQIAPLIGLFGTVVGVMITFAAIAAEGSVSVNAIAPGVAASLLSTVAGLMAAIPSLFAYNGITTRAKAINQINRGYTAVMISRLANDINR